MIDWQRGSKSEAEFEALVEDYLADCQVEESRLLNDGSIDEETRQREFDALRRKIDELQTFLARLRGQEVIGPDEARWRREIEDEAGKGLIAMDTVYTVYRPDIHRFDDGEGTIESG